MTMSVEQSPGSSAKEVTKMSRKSSVESWERPSLQPDDAAWSSVMRSTTP